jgi:adenylate cyclase class 2
MVKKLEELGATLVEDCYQYAYTYDLATIYGRFIDILTQLNNFKSTIKKETAVARLKHLFFEIDNLLSQEEKNELKSVIDYDNVSILLEKQNFLEIINSEQFISYISKFHNNENKWIRLRNTNNMTTIAVKHILADNGTKLEQMLETEIEVPSLKEANELLEALGFSHKHYQEKKRKKYELDNHEIDIDTWPGIPTYIEIEGTDEDDLEKILNKLGYTMNDTVSCTAGHIYEIYDKDIHSYRELKFELFE